MSIVTVKLQRPIVSNDSMQAVMVYTVDEDGERDSNPITEEMLQEDIDLLFGSYHKVYYLGKYKKGKPVEVLIQEPTREDEWV